MKRLVIAKKTGGLRGAKGAAKARKAKAQQEEHMVPSGIACASFPPLWDPEWNAQFCEDAAKSSREMAFSPNSKDADYWLKTAQSYENSARWWRKQRK